jgi:hypothetical protein
LVGQVLPVLYSARMRGGLVFVCELDGGKQRISLPQSWTDRGPEALPGRFAVEGLAAARVLIDAVVPRLRDAERDGA